MSEARPRIGFVGTGIMGGHMARRLTAAGFPVTAWNRTTAKAQAVQGVVVAASVEAALQAADVAIVMLSTGQVIDEVLFAGAVGALRPGATLVVMSSVPVETCRAWAAAVAERGIAFADAPVSGGEVGASDGTLAILVGAEQPTFHHLQPVFAPLGRVTRIGPIGSGQLAKLCNQIIVGGTMVAVAEALHLAERGGADPKALRSALVGGFGDSRILHLHGTRMVEADFTPGSPAKYQLKDMETALGFAAARGVDLTLLSTLVGLFRRMDAHGDGDLDVSAIIREVARGKTEASS